ncbi:MAG: hypothetical protein ACRDGJ_04665, partial [Candidatus Limnocylindria bacterium]
AIDNAFPIPGGTCRADARKAIRRTGSFGRQPYGGTPKSGFRPVIALSSPLFSPSSYLSALRALHRDDTLIAELIAEVVQDVYLAKP